MAAKKTRKMTGEQERWLQTVPNRHKPSYIKAMTIKSAVAAIRAKCYECNAYENAIKRTHECHIISCPLWPHRPGNTEWPKNDRSLGSYEKKGQNH